MSRRQLHEARQIKAAVRAEPARACGVEAVDEPQHRTQVNPRKAGLIRVSVPVNATPDIQSRQDGIEGGGGGTLLVLTQGDLHGSAGSGRARGGNDERSTPVEKSDLLVVALKPMKVGRAKGEMG